MGHNRDYCDPGDCPKKIEQSEFSPRHVKHASEWPRNDASSRHEASEEDRNWSVLFNQLLSRFNVRGLNPEEAFPFIEQRTAATPPNPVSDVVTGGGSDGIYDNDPGQKQLVAVMKRSDAGNDQNGFAGNGNARIFKQQTTCNRPVTPGHDEVLNGGNDVVHGRN